MSGKNHDDEKSSNPHGENSYGGNFEEYSKEFRKGLFEFLGIDPNDSEGYKNFKKEFLRNQNRFMTRQELLDFFNNLISEKINNKPKSEQKLKDQVQEKMYYVYAANAPDVFKIHAIACIHAKDYLKSISSIRQVRKNYSDSLELLGIMHYALKEYNNASVYFKHVKNPKENIMTPLFKSISDYNCGNSDMYKCSFDLEDILSKSSQANNFLGTIFYNKGEYSRAQDYFMQEVFLLKNSDNQSLIENSRINSLRALYVQDKVSAISNFSEFYAITNSGLTAEELIKKMEVKRLPIPHFTLPDRTLAKLADRLLV